MTAFSAPGAECSPPEPLRTGQIALGYVPVFCVVWDGDEFPDADGYRVRLDYTSQSQPSQTQHFVYDLPAHATSFVFPAGDSLVYGDDPVCLLRDSYKVEVVAVLRSTGQLVGSGGGSIHCGSGDR
jgi:hypothetical protein